VAKRVKSPQVYESYVDLLQVSTPSNPAATYGRLYRDSSNVLHMKDSAGAEGSVVPLIPAASIGTTHLAPVDHIDLNDSGVDNVGLPAAGDKRLGLTTGEQLCLQSETAGYFGPFLGGNGGAALTPAFEAIGFLSSAGMQFTRRNGTDASPTKIVSTNNIAELFVAGQTGTGADILKPFLRVTAAGDWDSTTDEPTRLTLYTIPDGSGTATAALTIDPDQSLHAGATTDQTLDRLAANTQTSTTYTLVRADMGKIIDCSNASAITLTVPANSSVAFPIGTVINVFQAGVGQVTISTGGTPTLRAPNGAKTAKQYATASLWKRATDEWVISGDTTT
jgi:hypothetical protein